MEKRLEMLILADRKRNSDKGVEGSIKQLSSKINALIGISANKSE